MLSADDRAAVEELAPALRRALALDPDGLVRLRLLGESATVLVRLPFGVLVSRTVPTTARADSLDVTARAADVLEWLEGGEHGAQPQRRDTEWRSGLPPSAGWRRIETVPDGVIRDLVRTGALALKNAAGPGLPGVQPPRRLSDALLDSVVLTVTDDAGLSAEVTLRALSALTRMGFLPRAGRAHIDAVGRWVRVVAEYGTVYLQRPGQSLGLA